jgi:hypothetical protein
MGRAGGALDDVRDEEPQVVVLEGVRQVEGRVEELEPVLRGVAEREQAAGVAPGLAGGPDREAVVH